MKSKTPKKRHRRLKWCTAQQLEAQLKALGAIELGEGRHRKTYLRKGKSNRKGKRLRRYVYKIPTPGWDDITYEECVAANHREYKRFRKRDAGYKDRFARCKLLPNDVLVMELVKEIHGGSVPRWAHQWDCWQVGKDRFGRVKLYDYAE